MVSSVMLRRSLPPQEHFTRCFDACPAPPCRKDREAVIGRHPRRIIPPPCAAVPATMIFQNASACIRSTRPALTSWSPIRRQFACHSGPQQDASIGVQLMVGGFERRLGLADVLKEIFDPPDRTPLRLEVWNRHWPLEERPPVYAVDCRAIF